MNKLLITLFALAIISNASAYQIEIKNATDGLVRVQLAYDTLDYAAGVVCTPENGTSQAGDSITLDVNCCPRKAMITALSGSAQGKHFEYTAPSVCTGFSFMISNLPFGQLTAKTSQ